MVEVGLELDLHFWLELYVAAGHMRSTTSSLVKVSVCCLGLMETANILDAALDSLRLTTILQKRFMDI